MFEKLRYNRRRFLMVSALAVMAAELILFGFSNPGKKLVSNHLRMDSELSSLSRATGWINSQPLTAEGLRGKVVLINFCTYSCINWLRQLPYVRAWAEKYKNKGLVVIGVHTPEFTFEKDTGNVQKFIKELGIPYPVAIDNDYKIWDAFKNNYWPTLYFFDSKGQNKQHQFGEGEYERSEKIIQQLLAEAGFSGLDNELVSVEATGVEAAADWENLQSSENYTGHDRTKNFASPGNAVLGRSKFYALPRKLRLNQWALSGEWTFHEQGVVSNNNNGRISYRFHSRDLHVVAGPGVRGSSVRFRLLIDGQPPGAAHGIDVDDKGNGTISEQRMYQLIRQPGPIMDRLFEIEFLDPGVEVFAFTFG